MTSHPSPSNPYRLLDTIQAARCSNHLSWPRSQASSFFERPCSRSRAASHPSEGGAAGGVFRGQGEAEGEGEESQSQDSMQREAADDATDDADEGAMDTVEAPSSELDDEGEAGEPGEPPPPPPPRRRRWGAGPAVLRDAEAKALEGPGDDPPGELN